MNNLLEIDKKNIWHPFTPLVGAEEPLFIESASGIFLNRVDGSKIIDAVSSWWVNLHGHSNPYIAKAIARQAKKLEHVIFAGFTHEPAIRLSENLLSILPENQTKVFYSDNGSTAVEVGLKMAFQYWHNQDIQKKKIIALKGAYHGDTFGSMSVGERSIFTNPFSSYLFETLFITFPDIENESRSFDEFKTLIDNDDVAAFIFEPLVQAAAGMRMYSSGVLDRMIQYARKQDVICIADEVFTGFGRTGKLFASDYLTNKPDIIALSKGITGGAMPLGVTTCSANIVAAYQSSDFSKTFFHGHSYTANPLACAAANASYDLLVKDECKNDIERITQQHQAFRNKIAGHEKIQHIRNLGTILAIELKSAETGGYTNALRKKIYPFFLERNILLRPLGNVLYVLPPYIITNDQLDKIYSCIEEFLSS